MRIAIISDIHSNIEALTEVKKEIGRLSIDRVICLGDVIGYGASPEPCCSIIRELAEISLLGNHDAAVSGRMDYGAYYEAARQVLDWTTRQLSPNNLAWLRSLPYSYRFGDLCFSHGAPLRPEAYEYIFAVEQLEELTPYYRELADVTWEVIVWKAARAFHTPAAAEEASASAESPETLSRGSDRMTALSGQALVNVSSAMGKRSGESSQRPTAGQALSRQDRPSERLVTSGPMEGPSFP